MSTFPINFKKRPAHVTFPIKSSELRSGYSAAETFFLNAGVEASLARKLALRCVSNYRRAAGATGARRGARWRQST